MADDSIQLRTEYSDQHYTLKKVALIAGQIEAAMRILSEGKDHAMVLAELRAGAINLPSSTNP